MSSSCNSAWGDRVLTVFGEALVHAYDLALFKDLRLLRVSADYLSTVYKKP